MYERFEGMTDEQIVKLAQASDGMALEYLLNKYKNFVRSKARSYFLIGADHEDIVQEGMIGLFKAVQDYDVRQETSFYSFAKLCITRQMYSAIEASKRKKHSPLNTYVSFYEKNDEKVSLIETMEAGGESNPEELLVSREYAMLLESKLEENLSALENRVLYLHLLGTDYKTIAKLLDKSPKTIDNALQRIKNKTEKILEKELEK